MSNFGNIDTGGMDLSGLGANGTTAMTYGAGPGNNGDGFTDFFGPPNRPVQVNPYELFSRQNFALPDAYVGRNDYLVNIIITTIREEEMWAGRIALPFRIADSQYEIQWDEIHFDNQLLGPVPEEGVSRLVTQRTSSRKDHYVRYGLAFQLEHGFMNTEKGKMSYVNNLKQIRNATLDTIYLGVIRAYLSCKSVGQALVEMYGTNPSQSQIRRIMSEELENWACVQKSTNAMQICDLRMKRRMRKMGATPDMWIFPEGMKSYITNVRRENFDYFLKGPAGPKMFQSGMSDGGQQLDIAMDCVIFEAKQFDIPEAPEPIDLLCRNQSIGEYVTLQNHLQGYNDWGKYSSRMRDIIVYNEERDSWSTLTLEQCLHFCMRFGEPAESGRNPHAHKRGRGGDAPNDDHKPPPDIGNEDDMFKSGDGTMALYLGDLQEFALNPRAVFDMSQCVYERIMRETDGLNVASALTDGVQLCRKITNPNMEEYKKILSPAAADGLEFGEDGFPTMESLGKQSNTILALTGFATYAGMKKVASITNDKFKAHKETADKLVKAVDIIYDRLQGIGNSVFLDADYQQPWIKGADGRNTLFANLIFEPVQQMFVNTKVAGPGITSVSLRITSNVDGQYAFNADPSKLRTEPGNDKMVKKILNTIENKYLQSEGKGVQQGSSPAQFADAVKNAYKMIMRTAENPSGEESALLEQESVLFIQGLARANIRDSDAGIKILKNILMVMVKAKELVGEEEKHLDLIDLHRSLRYVFSSESNKEFSERINNFISLVSMLHALLDDSDNSYGGKKEAALTLLKNGRQSFMLELVKDTSNFKKEETLNFFAVGDGANGYIGDYLSEGASPTGGVNRATQLGLAYGNKDYEAHVLDGTNSKPRMFGTRLDADFTTANGFGMEVYNESDVIQARQVGAQDDFDFYGYGPRPAKRVGFEDRTFAGVPSFGDGDMGIAESHRQRMMNDGEATAIKGSFSSTFKERYNFYSSQSASATELHRIVSQAYLGLPLTEGNLKKIIYTDLPFPFGFVCFRPYMTYRMGSGILAVKGNSTGETLIGHANFMLGDDPVQKMHIGNFTLYEKSVVYKPHQVGIAQNIYSMGYVGGNDCKFYSSRDQIASNSPGNIQASIFSCLVPYEGTGSSDHMQSASEFPNPMSITGKFEHGILQTLQGGNAAPHYPSASFYQSFWRWVSPGDPDQSDKMYEVPATLNTVCYQGHQQAYNPSTYQYDIVTTNTGHWGERIYPGCAKVRRGVEKMLQPVTYAGNSTPYPSVTQLDY